MSAKPAIYVLGAFHENAIATLREESRNLGLFQPGPDDSRTEAPGNFDVVLPDDPNNSSWAEKAALVLVSDGVDLSASVLQKVGGQLRYIVKHGAGVENIDIKAASEKNIRVYHAPGVNAIAVSELTIALAFAVARRIPEIDRTLRSGEKVVRGQQTLGKSLHSKTIGIIGMGEAGLEVARKWIGVTSGTISAYDINSPANAWTKEFPSEQFNRVEKLEDLLREADVISVHLPLSNTSRSLLNASRLKIVKEGAILLNTSHGAIVDEAALLEALQSGRLFGAGLDAVQHEPPTAEQYGKTLLSHPRVIITPHIGSSTEEDQAASGVTAVDVAVSLIEGRPEAVPAPLNGSGSEQQIFPSTVS